MQYWFPDAGQVRLKALTYTGTTRSHQLMYGAEQMLDLAGMLAPFNKCKLCDSSVANVFESGSGIGSIFRFTLLI